MNSGISLFLIGFSVCWYLVMAIYLLSLKERSRLQKLLGLIFVWWCISTFKDIFLHFEFFDVTTTLQHIYFIDGLGAITFTLILFELTMPGWVTLKRTLLLGMPFVLFLILHLVADSELLKTVYTVFFVSFAWCSFIIAIYKGRSYAKAILNTLQTNGTLLTDDWCRFFRDHHFRIGISIDGPEHLHNIYRRDAHGEGTFARTMNGLELLLKHGVELNTLTTVNAANADYPEDVYNFLRQHADFMQFLPVVVSLPESTVKNVALPSGLYTEERVRQLAPYSVFAKAYGHFLCTVTDLWLERDLGSKFIQTIESAIGNLTRRPAGLCVHEAVCGHCAVVEKNGDLYRCDRYVFPEYRIGNIMEAPLYDMMQTNRRFGEYKLDSLPHQCLHCDVADLCFGGCPKDRLLERMTLNGVERRNYLCDGYRQFFQHIRRIYPTIMNKIQ